MDNGILYPSIGIVILLIVIAVTLISASKNKAVKTKEQKQAEILKNYQEELHSTLSKIDDNEEQKAKKTEMLKRFSNELSRNVFFDKDEVRNVIVKLSKI